MKGEGGKIRSTTRDLRKVHTSGMNEKVIIGTRMSESALGQMKLTLADDVQENKRMIGAQSNVEGNVEMIALDIENRKETN